MTRLTVLNQDTAHFECVYPTCGSPCCRNGRPAIEQGERARIDANLAKFALRPAARARVAAESFVTNRRKDGLPMLAVVDGWCVFYNDGCALHALGAAEGEPFRYKPWRCAVFPLDRTSAGDWFVRQQGERGEAWDLFCLAPAESPRLAHDTMSAEWQLAAALQTEQEAWRFVAPSSEPGSRQADEEGVRPATQVA